MKRIAIRVVPVVALLAAGVAWMSPRAVGQGSGMPSTKNGDWPRYTADVTGNKYSPLDQISATNFSKLEVAWRFKTDNLGPRPEFNLQTTPLMVNGVLYATGGTRRSVIALNPGTGELLWKYSLDEGKRGESAPRQLSGRGVAYWTNGKEERILYVTPGYQLIALDAKTGRPIPSFGKGGIVDLKTEDDQEMAWFHEQTVPDIQETLRGLGNGPAIGIADGDIMFDHLELYPEFERGVSRMGIPFFQVGLHPVKEQLVTPIDDRIMAAREPET